MQLSCAACYKEALLVLLCVLRKSLIAMDILAENLGSKYGSSLNFWYLFDRQDLLYDWVF